MWAWGTVPTTMRLERISRVAHSWHSKATGASSIRGTVMAVEGAADSPVAASSDSPWGRLPEVEPIHSARYAPTAQACTERLLQELVEVPGAERSATFVCVAALVVPSGLAFARHSEGNGRIVTSVRGREGFGYDPVFELTGGRVAGMTMAEI